MSGLVSRGRRCARSGARRRRPRRCRRPTWRVRLAAVVAAAPVDVRAPPPLLPAAVDVDPRPADVDEAGTDARARRRPGRASASPAGRGRCGGGSARRSRAARRRTPRRGRRARSASVCSAVISAWWVTSRPIIVTSIPLANTRLAASGSAQMLNSAAGVRLPSPIEPPISTIRSGRASGCSASRSATFVSGPVGISVIAPSRARICSARNVDRVRRDRRPGRRRQVGAVQSRLAVDVRRHVRSRTSGCAAPAATGTSPGRRTRARAGRSRSSCRASELPATVVTPTSSTSGEASASSSAIASSWPGSQSRRIGVGALRLSYRLQLGGGRQRGLRAEPRRGERARRAGPAQRLLARPSLEQRDDEAGGERVAGGGAVDRRRSPAAAARATSRPSSIEHGALGAEGDGDEPAARDDLVLEPVDDRAGRARASIGRAGAAFSAKNDASRAAASTTSSGTSSWQSTAPVDRPRRQQRVRAGRRRRSRFSPSPSTEDQREPGLAPPLELELDAGRRAGRRAPRRRSRPRRRRRSCVTLAAEPRRRDGLVGSLAARDAARTPLAGDRLARAAAAARPARRGRG